MSDTQKLGQCPRVHLLYEYGPEYRPYSSSFIRLIRPLSHPEVSSHVKTTFSLEYQNEPADIVIIDRLWRRDISLQLVEELIEKIRSGGAKLVYSIDDDFFDLPYRNDTWPNRKVLPVVTFLLHQADVVLTSTQALRLRLLETNPDIRVMPNYLDERLLVLRMLTNASQTRKNERLVIGTMGTFTHDEDFRMVLPALQSTCKRYPGQILIQVIGMLNQEKAKGELKSLPVQYVYPRPEEHEYPLFMPWFTGHVRWDIAISPLIHTPFNDCKSDIKFLDYASIACPGIFSNSPAYSSTVHHQENGWLVENTAEAWEEALESLVNNHKLRLEIGQNASQYLYQERILARHTKEWVDLIKSIC